MISISSLLLRFLLSDQRFKLFYSKSEENRPAVSVVIPIFNQESVIYAHLKSIQENLLLPNEMVLIDDSSLDNSHVEIMKFIDSLKCSNTSIQYYRTRIPMFETRSEDFAIRNASGKYIILIQADMKIHEYGFDDKLVRLLESNTDIGLISCRGTHELQVFTESALLRGREVLDRQFFRPITRFFTKVFFKLRKIFLLQRVKIVNYPPQAVDEKNLSINECESRIFPGKEDAGSAGFLSNLIDILPYENEPYFASVVGKYSRRFWPGETVMRGPLIFERALYLGLGGFNTKAFFQGLDDHDFCLRIRKSDKVVGFSPIYFSSPMHLGMSRVKRRLSQDLGAKLHASLRKKNLTKSELLTTLLLKHSPRV